MRPNDHPPSAPVPGDFADTVQSDSPEPPSLPDGGGVASGTAHDVSLEFGAESDSAVAEKPTLSHIGRYALKSLLGEGGLGRVYEAWDPLLSRAVAVKTLQFDLDMPSRIALDRQLLNEARAAANLNHAHIVTVHDAGLSAHGVYIAMERLRGRDLRQMLDDGWRPTPDAAAQVVRRVADALAYAHARGVVHCDIKPGNIFLTRKDKPKVLDFGIARAAHASVPGTGEALIIGSPHYVSPEQLDGRAVDARTDIYALGVVLYELLCGRKAFRGDSLEAIHQAVSTGQYRALTDWDRALPPALVAIVSRAMALDPAERFSTAGDLSTALRHGMAAAAGASTPDTAPTGTPTRPTSRKWVTAALAATTVLSAAAWWSLQTTQTAALTPVAALPSRPAAEPVVAVQRPVIAVATSALDASAPPQATAATAAPAASAARSTTPAAPATTRAAATKPRAPTTKPSVPAATATTAPTEVPTGILQIAITPWGEVEVNGKAAGTTPPLTRLTLPQGTHTVTIRNADFPPHTTTVQVHADKPAVVRHRFGS